MIAKFSGWAMKTVAAAGIADRTPAVVATRGSARASRAIAQVSGAASEPMIASGSADAMGLGPSRAMNGTWTKLASGSQWAFEGIGRVAGIRDPVADLGEDPDEVDVQAVAGGDRPGDVDVVVAVRVRGIRVDRDQGEADEQRQHEQGDGGPHGSAA